MKKTKIILSMIVLLILLIQTIKAQTNVSGGIYSNTTWTAANSPYIVTDTVVVFPGVTLTIMPGVTVKFNNHKLLEIRQGIISAIGTNADSIYFTSNSLNPTSGIWEFIWLNNTIDTSFFNFCNFYYASTGIWGNLVNINKSSFLYNLRGANVNNAKIDSCIFMNNSNNGCNVSSGIINYSIFLNNFCGMSAITVNPNETIVDIKHCKFNYNQIGALFYDAIINMTNCEIKNNNTGITDSTDFPFIGFANVNINNCIIDSNNLTGIDLSGFSYSNIITQCQIKNNGYGLKINSYTTIESNRIENNIIGIKFYHVNNSGSIQCNKICENISFDIINTSNQSANISGNYWCTNDSALIALSIYDGYDNINMGILTFLPLDTSQCYLTAGTKEKEINNISFNFFPNPAYDKLTLTLSKNNLQTEVKIYNLIGQLEFISKIENTSTELNILKLTKGIYIIELTIDEKIIRKKFIKQ